MLLTKSLFSISDKKLQLYEPTGIGFISEDTNQTDVYITHYKIDF